MKLVSVFKTHTFKIHNITKKKEKLILKSMVQSRLCFYKAVHAHAEQANNLINQDKKVKREGLTAIKKSIAQLVKPLPFSGAIKASTIEDVAAQLSSYIELTEVGQNASLPKLTDHEIDYQLALNDLLRSTTKEQEDIARNEMSRAMRNDRETLSYYKSRTGDGFLLLQDDKSRLFAFVNLWAAKDKRATKVTGTFINTRTGEELTLNTSTGLLLPLECSNWHLNALKTGQSKAAKLFIKNGEFFFAVSVEYEREAREPKNIMGVDRGIDEIASYAVRDPSGKVIAKGNLDGTVLRAHQRRFEEKQKNDQRLGKKFTSQYSNYSDNLVHHIANSIVEIADKHDAQVVIEDLTAIKNGAHHKRKKFARKSNFSRMLSRQQYGKLEFMLNYKLQFVGLPKSRSVHAAYTSVTCPKCGFSDKVNRPERAVFICHECDYKEHADLVGSINIAGKLLWLQAVGSQIKGNKLTGKNEKYRFNSWQSRHLQV